MNANDLVTMILAAALRRAEQHRCWRRTVVFAVAAFFTGFAAGAGARLVLFLT